MLTKSQSLATMPVNRMPGAQKHDYTVSAVSRYRWNVLGLLSTFATRAITAHLFCDIDMSLVEESREKLTLEGKHVTVTAYLLKAISIAQESSPISRTACLGGWRLVTYNEVVAGFTVERVVDGQPAVFFGEIENSSKKSLEELAAELKKYSEADLEQIPGLKQQVAFVRFPWFLHRLVMEVAPWFPALRLKCMKATFGMSSLGALGVKIACGPSVCTSVFGVGKVEERPIVCDDKIVIKPMLTLALSYDQRVMDGAQASRFLVRVKHLLENGLDTEMNRRAIL